MYGTNVFDVERIIALSETMKSNSYLDWFFKQSNLEVDRKIDKYEARIEIKNPAFVAQFGSPHLSELSNIAGTSDT